MGELELLCVSNGILALSTLLLRLEMLSEWF